MGVLKCTVYTCGGYIICIASLPARTCKRLGKPPPPPTKLEVLVIPPPDNALFPRVHGRAI